MSAFSGGVPAVRIGDWLREGWDIFASDVGMFILAALIFTLLAGLCFPILYGPLSCGMYIMVFDRMRGRRADAMRIFAGFDYFGKSFVAALIFLCLGLLAFLVFWVGFLLCVIPSLIGIGLMILLQTAFLFVFQLIAEQGLDAADAISVSYGKVKENIWEFLLFGVVLWLISAAGYSLTVGWIVTVPLTFGATAAAYRDMFGLEGELPPVSAV